MNVISRETYAIPVFSFDDPESWDDEPNRPESEDDERLIVLLRERQAGMPDISITEKHGDERVAGYTFRVTDSDLQWCAYTGDESDHVPAYVIHAAHEFGYGVENITTLGQWYTDRWECQSAFSELLHQMDDLDDSALKALTQNTTYLLDMLDTVLVVRYGTTDEEFAAIRSEYRDAHPTERTDGLDLGPLKDHYWDAAHDHDCGFLLGDEEGDSRINVGVSTAEFEAQNGPHLDINIATSFGIERFLFHQQDEDTCAYVSGGQSSRPNPQAVLTLQEEGYEVTNAQTVATAETLTDVAEYGLILADDLRNRPEFTPDDPADPLGKLIEAAYDRLFSLFQAFAAREYDPEQYEQKARLVREHVGIPAAQMTQLPQAKLTELIVATIELMDDPASEQARERVKRSQAYTEELAEQVGRF